MSPDLYSEYAELEGKIRALSDKRDELRQVILSKMVTEGNEKVSSNLGTFSVGHKVTWSYSPAVTKLEENLKIKKIQEQKKGVAEAERAPYLMYRPAQL